MTSPSDLLPYAGLAVAIACLVTAAIGRWRRWAVGAALLLCVAGLVFPTRYESAEAVRPGLHPFPESLFFLLLAITGFLAGCVGRLLYLGIIGAWRRLKRA